MTNELKPCPFCGGEAKCIEYYGLHHVVCFDCHISGRDSQSIETAQEAWNTRPLEDAKDKRIKELEQKLEIAREALKVYAPFGKFGEKASKALNLIENENPIKIPAFGRLIRRYRILTDDRLYDMAKRLNIPSAVLCAYETGNKEPSDRIIDAIAEDILNVRGEE